MFLCCKNFGIKSKINDINASIALEIFQGAKMKIFQIIFIIGCIAASVMATPGRVSFNDYVKKEISLFF